MQKTKEIFQDTEGIMFDFILLTDRIELKCTRIFNVFYFRNISMAFPQVIHLSLHQMRPFCLLYAEYVQLCCLPHNWSCFTDIHMTQEHFIFKMTHVFIEVIVLLIKTECLCISHLSEQIKSFSIEPQDTVSAYIFLYYDTKDRFSKRAQH